MAVGTITQLNLVSSLGAGTSTEPGAAVGLATGLKMWHGTVIPTSGANYTAGGVVIPAATFGFTAILGGICAAITQAATVGPGEVVVLPQADGSIKLKCNLAAGTGDNAGNADLSGTLVDLFLFGY